MYTPDQRGVVGLAALLAIIIAVIILVLLYVADVRSGEQEPIGTQLERLVPAWHTTK